MSPGSVRWMGTSSLLVAAILGCLWYQLRLLQSLHDGWRREDLPFHSLLEYDSPLLRVEWHPYYSNLQDAYDYDGILNNKQHKFHRVLMIQYFSTLNFSISNNNNNNPEQEIQRYTRQTNSDYAQHWGHDYLQVMGRVNQTQSLLEILDALKNTRQSYDYLLLLPHEGILWNDFLFHVTDIISSSNANDASSSKRTQRPKSKPSILCYTQSQSYCQSHNADNTQATLSVLDLLWNQGMTLWEFSKKNDALTALLRSLQSKDNILTTTMSAPTLLRNYHIELSCFPTNLLGRVYCDSRRNPPETPTQIIQWFNYSTSSASSQLRNQRLLIAQYAGHGTYYGNLLNTTSTISRRYCRKWKCDVVVLQGKPWTVQPLDDLCPSPAHRASFSKLTLLQLALNHTQQYDYLLLLDADALIYDWNYDVTTLLSAIDPLPMMTGHKVKRKSDNYTWNVNNGATLWNLHHSQLHAFVTNWDLAAQDKILQVAWKWQRRREAAKINNNNIGPPRVGDQELMHKTLRQMNLSSQIYGSRKVMEYENGTVVKHLIRSDSKQWGNHNTSTDSEYRYDALKRFSQELCIRYPEDCTEDF